ncbi:3'-5' exonuclease [Granulosicoccus sp. 3-233]|uniref:3'-5' exonuclease n=1 Tax=Granulosicoccus sp. 3-233 TaxID=3417969 RepID=UPI003D349A6C
MNDLSTVPNVLSGKALNGAGSYAVVDFETTGLSPHQGDRAIEIGISMFRDGKEVGTYASLINPGMRIPSFITQLTGISNDMVSSAPTAREVFEEALAFVGDAQLVAHNASFDRKFWRRELSEELGIECQRQFVCTLMLARRVFQSFTSHRLGEIARVLGIDTGRSHRALDDARVTTVILATMLDRLQAANPEQTIDGAFLQTYQKKARTQLPDLS